MIYTEYGSLLRLNVAISGFLRYLWLTAKYGLRQTSESRFLTLVYTAAQYTDSVYTDQYIY
jgi:hypothetical protein